MCEQQTSTTDECANFEGYINVYIHATRKTIKINPTHPVVTKIVEQLEADAEGKSMKENHFL
jgi:hypothetical protein